MNIIPYTHIIALLTLFVINIISVSVLRALFLTDIGSSIFTQLPLPHGFHSQDVAAVSSNTASASERTVINLSLSLSGATPTVMQQPCKFHIRANYTRLAHSNHPQLCLLPVLPLSLHSSLNHILLVFLSNNLDFKAQVYRLKVQSPLLEHSKVL